MEQSNKIIIANWKMKLNVAESVALAEDIRDSAEHIKEKDIVLCPSFLAIHDVAKVLEKSKLILGAQDTFYEEEGAYTGEVSADNLKALGCTYVIVGHSERRALGETDEVVNKKVKASLMAGLIPIICVGEKLSERQANETEQVLARQVSTALQGIKDQSVIIAYEPVWSISTSGSGQVITSQQANEQIEVIRQNIPTEIKNFKIIYGGSVTSDNVAEFISDFSGALVGGASLQAKTFINLINNA